MKLKVLILTILSVTFATSVAKAQIVTAFEHGISFRSVWIRSMTPEEKEVWAGDNLNPDLLIGFRIENISAKLVRYRVSFPNDIDPDGNNAQLDGKKLLWSLDVNTTSLTSPGIDRLAPGAWRDLPPGSAVEWTELEISRMLVKPRVRSMFIETKLDSPPLEVISHPYEYQSIVKSVSPKATK